MIKIKETIKDSFYFFQSNSSTRSRKPTKAVKLTPNDGEAPMYFVIVNDTTLRLVNDSLQEAVSDLNYDIIKVKK